MLLRPQDSRVEEARLHRLGLRSWASSHVQGSGGAAVRRCGGAVVRWCGGGARTVFCRAACVSNSAVGAWLRSS